MHRNKPEHAQQRITRTGGLVRGVPLPGGSRLWGTHQKPPDEEAVETAKPSCSQQRTGGGEART